MTEAENIAMSKAILAMAAVWKTVNRAGTPGEIRLLGEAIKAWEDARFGERGGSS